MERQAQGVDRGGLAIPPGEGELGSLLGGGDPNWP